MKWKYTQIILYSVSIIGSYIAGLHAERTLSQKSLDEIIQIAQEACDARIKTIKFACRK